MAYLIFSANGIETERRELPPAQRSPLVIGRAPDCDIPVPDILLSRHHCQLERVDGSWVALDLGSKNGTYLGNKQISRHVLGDGDTLRLGPRTRVVFNAGEFQPNPLESSREVSRAMASRPIDPHEALQGTVSGFLLVEPGEAELDPRMARAPRPQPKPLEPDAYRTEDVYGMLSELMSSSWDSIREQASKPIVGERPMPRPGVSAPPKIKRKSAISMSLQADAAPAEPAPDTHAIGERADSIGDSIAGMTVIETLPSALDGGEAPLAEDRFSLATSTIMSSDEPTAARRGWFGQSPRRPSKPNGRTAKPIGRRQHLVAMVAIVLTAALLAAWSAALWIMPQYRRTESIKVDLRQSMNSATSNGLAARPVVTIDRAYGPYRKPIITIARRAPFEPEVELRMPTPPAQPADTALLIWFPQR